MTVTGTDVSHWNENPPLDTFDFVIHKATQGAKWQDDSYSERHQWARDRGKQWGAYHFYTPRLSAAQQLANFANYARIQPGDIVGLDFEDDETWHNYAPQVLAAECDELMRLLWKAYPDNRILLYCNRSAYRTIIQPYSVFLGDGLWIASPGAIPQMEWILWQYGSGSVDYDRANFATLEDLINWAGTKGDNFMANPSDVWKIELNDEAPGSRNNPDPNHVPYSEKLTAGVVIQDTRYLAADALKEVQALRVQMDALEGSLNQHEVDLLAAIRNALGDQEPDQVTLTPEQTAQLVNALPDAVQQGLRNFYREATAEATQ